MVHGATHLPQNVTKRLGESNKPYSGNITFSDETHQLMVHGAHLPQIVNKRLGESN